MLVFSLNKINSILKSVFASITIPIISASISFILYEVLRQFFVGFKPHYLMSLIPSGFYSYFVNLGWIMSFPILLICIINNKNRK
jgi:hypothetical protein